MDDRRVAQVLDFVSISLKHNHRRLVFLVKSLVECGHQSTELGAAAKSRLFLADAERSLATPVSLNERIQGLLQTSLVTGEAGEQFDIVGNDRHLIAWPKIFINSIVFVFHFFS